MAIKYSEYFKVASRIVDDLPEALGQLDTWIAQAEANPTNSAEISGQLKSAESLRDGLASVLTSVESGAMIRSVEPEANLNNLIASLESASGSLNTLADSLKNVPSVEDAGHLQTVVQTAEGADTFAASVEASVQQD